MSEYTDQYNKNNYERITVRVPKGEAEKIKIFVAGGGESVNEFINRIISYHVPDFKRIREEDK